MALCRGCRTELNADLLFENSIRLEDDAKFGMWLLMTVRRKALEMKNRQHFR